MRKGEIACYKPHFHRAQLICYLQISSSLTLLVSECEKIFAFHQVSNYIKLETK